MAPTTQLANEAMARGAQQLRAETGSQNAPRLGQGAAVASQQATEGKIFGGVADTQLKIAQLGEQVKQQGVGYAVSLEQLGQSKLGLDMNAVQMLIQQGGAENLKQASAKMAEMFPGVNVDFSRTLTQQNTQDVSALMNTMSQLAATGVPQDQAVALMKEQGLTTKAGFTDTQLSAMYDNVITAGNPVASTLHAYQNSGLAPDVVKSLQKGYMENLTGSEMTQDAKGDWHVVPSDGYTKVTSLSNLSGGEMIKTETPMFTANGTSVPAGEYHVVASEHLVESGSDWYHGTATETNTHTLKLYTTDGKYVATVDTTKDAPTTKSSQNYSKFLDPLSLFN